MADKSADQSAGKNLPDKIPQPHGGALFTGGKPGNPGGGRTPSALRRRALKKGPKMLKVLEEIANDENAKQSDRVAAAKEMLRVGLGTAYSEGEVRDKLQATIMMLDRTLDEDKAAQAVFELRRIWVG